MLYQEIHRPQMYQAYPHHPPQMFGTTSHIPAIVSFNSAANDLQPSIMKTVAKPHISEDGHHQGRWTKKEHDAFLQGLRLYGREWKQIAKTIPTRTSAQIRSHAQKYFQKLNKEGIPKKPDSNFHQSKLMNKYNDFNDVEGPKFVSTQGRIFGQVDISPIISANGPCIISDPQNATAHIPFNPTFSHSSVAYPFFSQTNCFESPTIPVAQCSGGFVRDQYQEEYKKYLEQRQSSVKEEEKSLDECKKQASEQAGPNEDSKVQNLIHECADRLNLNFDDKEICALEFLCSSKKRLSPQEDSEQESSPKKQRLN
mmetsp:Transcript_30198/g.39797  ORF Transcript_30198/g.39797 Transcript_30198/m.39797 type:complete len:312 (+) Transcript_30198:111-1046(+)|eukprot:CAMPEP_0117752474 /NCGR_PEP_ID=MMETSP0947-20121206/11629_1 /TAXON_ID=44440 /ORGANISM="Chattonella subsalsa, Strain CCMP2191" /LENGTH=311 /DNA_ID=CAMNT_0005571127 /DNA_START=86 /DNA_END=1021 /DNA_ORIENTATION=+